MAGNLALGIDLGGSKIYAVVTDSENNVVSYAKTPTDPSAGPEKTAENMKVTAIAALDKLSLKLEDVDYFGAAVPSPVDPVTGDCVFATNLNWKKASMTTLLRNVFRHEFRLGNDANLGMLGEYAAGAAKGFRNGVGYFIGTGLGGGILIDGKILTGNMGVAGELGHTVIEAGGRKCGCGHRGCVEAYCSKMAFVKALKKEIFKRGTPTTLPGDKFTKDSQNIKSKYLARAYADEDPAVRKVIDKGLRMLGVSAASVCATLAPEVIVLGGGFAEAMGEMMMQPFVASFRRHLFGLNPDKVSIRLSALGDHCVAVGATVLARGGAPK